MKRGTVPTLLSLVAVSLLLQSLLLHSALAFDTSKTVAIDATGNVGEYTSTTLGANGRLAASYYDTTNGDLKVWIDDGRGAGTAGNRIADGTEVRTVDSTGNVGRFSSIAIDSNGRLAVSYFDDTNGDLKLWVDDGIGGGTAGNGVADGTEIRLIDETGVIGAYSSMTLNSSGRLAISYYDDTNDNLRVWVDDGSGAGTAGNGIADGTELRTIDATGDVGSFTSVTLDLNGRLAISYFDATNGDLKLWVDDANGGGTANNIIADGSEIRSIDSTGQVGRYSSITLDSNSRLAISYSDDTNSDLKLWVDDGTGGGTAGNAVADGTESRTLDSTGSVGIFTAITLDLSGRLAVSYHDETNLDLKVWTDNGSGGGTPGNGVADGTELRTLDSAGTVGLYTAITLDANGRLATTYFDSTNGDLKLATLIFFEGVTIDSAQNFGYDTSITVDANDRLAVSHYDLSNQDLRLWVDDGRGGGTPGNGSAEGTEVRILDSVGNVGQHTAITVDVNGRLAVSYEDGTNRDLKLWIDDGRGGGTAGNGVADGTEIRTLDSTDDVGGFTSITKDSNNRLAVSYYDSTNEDLKLWVDDARGGGTAGNGIADGTEVRTLDSTGNVGGHTSITVDSNSRLAISYHEESSFDLKLWVDDGSGGGTAGNGLAEGTEIRTIETANNVGTDNDITVDASGRIAISYYRDDPGFVSRHLRLWVDDGNGGGTAGNLTADGSEIRTIDGVAITGSHTSITRDSNDRLAISYFAESETDLRLWVDDGNGGGTAGNGIADGAEIRTLDTSAGDLGRYTSITLDANGEIAISYQDLGAVDLKVFRQARNVADLDTRGNGLSITNGDTTPSSLDDTDFGDQLVASGTVTKTYTVENLGGEPLVLGNGSVSISGAAAADFTVTTAPLALLRRGRTSTFAVVFDPSVTGQRSASISIANSALNESPFTFAVQGTGTVPTPTPTVTPTPTETPTATETPTVTPTFTATSTPTATETPTVTPTFTATATATSTATPTASATPTAIPTVTASPIPTVGATPTPVGTVAPLFQVTVIRKGPRRGLGALRLLARNATSSSIGVRTCLPVPRFNDASLRDYFLVLRSQGRTQRQVLRVRRNSACGEFTIRSRGNYLIRFEQSRGSSVVRSSEEVLFGVN